MGGCTSTSGIPTIKEHQPPLEVSALPRAEGAFQGRIDALKLLGTSLTGDHRPRIITIHGGGGQGKTALAREAAERFAYAWVYRGTGRPREALKLYEQALPIRREMGDRAEEAESLFEANIAQARSSCDEHIVKVLELHLSILHACKARGIAATFKQITAAQEDDLPFDADLIARSTQHSPVACRRK